jgi:hypothetical protein
VRLKDVCVRPKVSLEDKVHSKTYYHHSHSQLTKQKTKELQMLLKEFKDVFAWTYKDLRGIPQELAQHIIEFRYFSSTITSSKI